MTQTRITTLNEFMQWVEQFDSGSYLFRGVPNAVYRIEASAFRRPKETDRDFEKFLQINRSLIRDARLQSYDEKDGGKLKDLEILAEFQHFGAATCLIDFTYNALIALWFACQPDSKVQPDVPKIPDGKVFAVKNEPPRFKEVTLELLEKRLITSLKVMETRDRRFLNRNLKQLYQWRPSQQNHRIIAQQSIFLFGDSHIDEDAKCIISGNHKKYILATLQQGYGITEAMLFPDFAGFAHLHSEGRSYTELGASEYRRLANVEFRRRKYELAIAYYDKAINLDPNDAHTYYYRGCVYRSQEQHELAIENYDKAIDLTTEDHVEFYDERARANFSLKRYWSAIEDYSEAIRIFPNNGNYYYQRGLAKAAQKQYEAAIADYDEVIRIHPRHTELYRWRGFAKYELERYEAAIADYNEAIRIHPHDRKSYYQRGLAKYGLKQYKAAITDFNKVIDLTLPLDMDPHDAYAYYWRALSKKELSHLKEARADLETALPLAFKVEEDPQLAVVINDLLREMNSALKGDSENE